MNGLGSAGNPDEPPATVSPPRRPAEPGGGAAMRDGPTLPGLSAGFAPLPSVEPSYRPPLVVTGPITLVTIYTHQRKPILARESARVVLVDSWCQADAWVVGRYLLMPDHLHLFCAPRKSAVSVHRWANFWKSLATRRWPRPEEQPLWQTDFWHSQLAPGETYQARWDYVRMNPVRKGLVRASEDWSFSGEINSLLWPRP